MQDAVPTPFDSGTTGAEVASTADLRGRLAVVTGGSAGLGKETARALASAGADVVLGARSRAQLEDAQRELSGGAGQILAYAVDLTDLESVGAFADEVLALARPVDILVNNAGIMACPLARTGLGIEAQLATNFVGHALLTSLMSGALVAAGHARLVSLSSTGHHFSPVVLDDLNFERRAYDPWLAYGQSKTACSLLAVHASARLAAKGVTALTVHPGVIQTDLLRYLTPSVLEEADRHRGTNTAGMPAFKSLASGAATSVWAATASVLEGHRPLYLEDCGVAPLIKEPNFSRGVMPYALDAAAAAELWAATEHMLGRSLPL